MTNLTYDSTRREILKATAASLALMGLPGAVDKYALAEIVTKYNYAPKKRNVPLGDAKGIHPGRVVWVRDPKAAYWSGDRGSVTDQWWMDASTDQGRVDAMISTLVRNVTGETTDEEAWRAIFSYYGKRYKGRGANAYRPGEIVAVKVNMNNSNPVVPTNLVNVSPQVTLALVRQLVTLVHVEPQNILVYDAQRDIYPGLLDKIWNDYKDVRFVQRGAPDPEHQTHPAYGEIHGLEQALWVEGQSYSGSHYGNARFIPQQVKDATYILNVALVKGHSYPYAAAEGGDEGKTGVTLTGKNPSDRSEDQASYTASSTPIWAGRRTRTRRLSTSPRRRIWARRPSFTFSTGFIALAGTCPIRCTFRTPRSSTEWNRMRTQIGRQAFLRRWMESPSTRSGSTFSIRKRRTISMRTAIRGL